MLKKFYNQLFVVVVYVLILSCSSYNDVDDVTATASGLSVETAKKCEVHNKPMIYKVALEDEAGFYSTKFIDDRWKKSPHDGYLYNVCQIVPGTKTWVCPDCVNYSKKARITGRIY